MQTCKVNTPHQTSKNKTVFLVWRVWRKGNCFVFCLCLFELSVCVLSFKEYDEDDNEDDDCAKMQEE